MSASSILYSNITYIIIFILTLVIVAGSYVYIFYYNHRLSNNEEITTLRKVLFWGLVGSAIVISIVFCIYVSVRLFRPLANVAVATLVAGSVPIIAGSENTPLITYYTSSEVDMFRKKVFSKYSKLSDSSKLQVSQMLTNAETLYKQFKASDPTRIPESVYNLYSLTNDKINRLN